MRDDTGNWVWFERKGIYKPSEKRGKQEIISFEAGMLKTGDERIYTS